MKGQKETLGEFLKGWFLMVIVMAVAIPVLLNLLDRAIDISQKEQAAADREAVVLVEQILGYR